MATSAIAVARAILTAALPDMQVAPHAPNPLPRRFVRLTRAGGARTRELDRPRLLVECFASTVSSAPDVAGAEQLALDAYDALRRSPNGGPWAGGVVTLWDGNTIADYDDPDQSTHSRWQFAGTLYLLNN